MTDSDTLKLFCFVLALVIVALVSMGCVEQKSQSQDSTPQVIYDGQESPAGSSDTTPSPSVAATSQPGAWTQQENTTRNFGNRTDMQQAAIEACTGKAAGDSCTLSFGNGDFTGGRQGGMPPNMNGSVPTGPMGNATMPSGSPQGGTMQQPTGTCEALDGTSTLSCTMQRPTVGG